MKGMGLDARIGAGVPQRRPRVRRKLLSRRTPSRSSTRPHAVGYDFALLRAVIDVNRERAAHLVGIMTRRWRPLENRIFAVLGLAFKPNTDDMREAKSIEIITELLEPGATVRAYDPVAMDNARTMLPPWSSSATRRTPPRRTPTPWPLVTEWNEFKFLNLERLRRRCARARDFDGRNMWEPERMRRLGFEYHSIGRRPVLPA